LVASINPQGIWAPEKLTSNSTQEDCIDMLNRLYFLDAIKSFTMKLTSDIQRAEDILSESYIKGLTNINNWKFWLNGNYNMKAWFFTIIKNEFINQYRKRTRENTMWVWDEVFLENVWWYTNWNALDILALKEAELALSKLDEKMRVPAQMTADWFKYKEIAVTLGKPLGTIKSRIFFWRKALRKNKDID
jgi:RNA polymerase sigma-70 factor (ECF subfamily)